MDELDLRPWDPAENLRDHRDCIGALDLALQYDDPQGVIETIGDIARSKELTDLVTGIGRYVGPNHTLVANGEPTLVAVIEALRGLEISLYAGPRRGGPDDEAPVDDDSVDIEVDVRAVSD